MRTFGIDDISRYSLLDLRLKIWWFPTNDRVSLLRSIEPSALMTFSEPPWPNCVRDWRTVEFWRFWSIFASNSIHLILHRLCEVYTWLEIYIDYFCWFSRSGTPNRLRHVHTRCVFLLLLYWIVLFLNSDFCRMPIVIIINVGIHTFL